jgi:hypothetical protein
MEEGRKAALARLNSFRPNRTVNGWAMLPTNVRFFGDDYFLRALIFSKGPYPNDTEEAFYPRGMLDEEGQLLNGAERRYVLRLSGDDMALAKYFWSLTMYDTAEGLLVENPINRYAISNQTPGLKYGADGSLSVVLQHDSPGPGQESNWLPAPQGPFYVVLRVYGPKDKVLKGEWRPPVIKRLK